jgi:hypothetical protein
VTELDGFLKRDTKHLYYLLLLIIVTGNFCIYTPHSSKIVSLTEKIHCMSETTNQLNEVMKKYENAFSIISTGTNYHFNEHVLANIFLDIRVDMDQIYIGSETTFKGGVNTHILMLMCHRVQDMANQFDDKLQAGLLMKMDVFATILGTCGVPALYHLAPMYKVHAECASVEFSGLFFEEALPRGPWEPSAENYAPGDDWVEWYRLDAATEKLPLLPQKRKRTGD